MKLRRQELRLRTWANLPLTVGNTQTVGRIFTFDGIGQQEHVVLGVGPYQRPADGVPLVRVHSECLTGDAFGSRRCDCGPQLAESLERIAVHGGYLVYLRQEGRGIGLYAKVEAYRLQEQGLDTFDANTALGHAEDAREFLVAGAMLRALDVTRVALITGNRQKGRDLEAAGVTVCQTIPTALHETVDNASYLDAKRRHGMVFRVSPGHAVQ